MEDKINVKEILQVLQKRLGLIISIALGALLLSALYTFFIVTPQYQSSTQILVNQTQENEQPITANELQSNREIVNTYNVIMTSPIILDTVIEETGVNKTVEELQNQMTVSSEEDSQVVTLSVQDSDPELASTLANNTAQVFEEEVPNIMNIDNVSILSQSEVTQDSTPVSPQPILNLIVAFIVGSVLGIALALLLDFLDQTIKTEQDVEKILKLPLLGAIPLIEKEMNDTSTSFTQKSNKYRQDKKSS